MAKSDKIEEDYELILRLAGVYDTCFFEESNKKHSWNKFSLDEAATGDYWELRGELEEKLSLLMAALRKKLESIPASKKTFIKLADSPKVVIHYENKNYLSLLEFFEEIKNKIEGDRGIMSNIRLKQPISSDVRDLRGNILSFLRTAKVLLPEVISIEKEVDIIFKLRKMDLNKVAEEIEAISTTEDNKTKCLHARTALEQIIEFVLRKKGLQPQRSFFGNLNICQKEGLIEKASKKPIASTYTFASKICHSELDASLANIRFSINSIYQIIEMLLPKD